MLKYTIYTKLRIRNEKNLALLTALVIALSLAACGGVDKDAVTEAFNSTNTKLNTVITFANDNLDKMDQETSDELQKLIDAMAAYKAEILSDDLTQARADTETRVPHRFKKYRTWHFRP